MLCFIILICAGVTLGAVSSAEDNADRLNDGRTDSVDFGKYRSAAGWMLFVAIMGMIIEPSLILVRFLNVEIVNKNFLLFGFVVSNYFVTCVYICMGYSQYTIKCTSMIPICHTCIMIAVHGTSF